MNKYLDTTELAYAISQKGVGFYIILISIVSILSGSFAVINGIDFSEITPKYSSLEEIENNQKELKLLRSQKAPQRVTYEEAYEKLVRDQHGELQKLHEQLKPMLEEINLKRTLVWFISKEINQDNLPEIKLQISAKTFSKEAIIVYLISTEFYIDSYVNRVLTITPYKKDKK